MKKQQQFDVVATIREEFVESMNGKTSVILYKESTNKMAQLRLAQYDNHLPEFMKSVHVEEV